MSIYNLSDKLDFGKYKLWELESIIKSDPKYIRWCLSNIKWFKINNNAQYLLDDQPIRINSYRGGSSGYYDDIDHDNEFDRDFGGFNDFGW